MSTHRMGWFGISICVALAVLQTGCNRHPASGRAAAEGAEEESPTILEAAGADPAPSRTDSSATAPPNKNKHEDLFAKPVVLSIDIEVPRTGMNALRRTQWGGGGGEERPIAKATVREGGVVYTDVAVHLKGAAGSFRPVDDHPAFTLNFDKFIKDQNFHGLHKISLNNSVQDPSYLSEKICRELFDAAGVPVPRAGHALVKLNGRDLGLYVMLEGANKQFLKRYFKNTKGNLYDGGFVRDVDVSLSVNSGDDPNDRSGLRALKAALRETSQTGSLASLEKALDVDRFVSMMAMEVLIIHWDGYAMNRNNWRIFHDLDSNRMVFIPHGLDQTFGVGADGRLGGNRKNLFSPPVSGSVAAAVLRTADGRRRYRERLGQLSTNVFKLDEILSRADETEAVIHTALARSNPPAARDQEQQAAWFKQLISRRAEEVRRQMGVPPPAPVKFGSDGVVPLTAWKQSLVRSGEPVLNETKDEQGRTLLTISSASGATSSSGSWRVRSMVPTGSYRFEGKMRLKGVTVEPGDQRSGAGLRISKGTNPRKLNGTTPWMDYTYEFKVDDDTVEIEFICELKALRGEVQFDKSSLRLVRLP